MNFAYSLTKKFLATLFAAWLTVGCTSIGSVDPGTFTPTQTEAFFLFGLQPDQYRIAIFSGSIENGVFKQSFLSQVPVFYGGPSDGYVMGKAKPGDVLAVTVVRTGATALSDFSPCGAQRTVVFKLQEPGKVAYFGDITLGVPGKQLQWQFKQNTAMASKHLAAKAPDLADRLVSRAPDLLPVAARCSR